MKGDKGRKHIAAQRITLEGVPRIPQAGVAGKPDLTTYNIIKRPHRRGPAPAWSFVLLFAVIAILAAASLYFFVLKSNDTLATAPSEAPVETVEPTPTPTPAPTPVPTPTPIPTPVTMWGANFPDKFTTGETIIDDGFATPTISDLSPRFQDCEVVGSYKSAHVNVTMNKVREDGITYYAADIYITDLKYFTGRFSSGKYKGARKYVYQIARDNDAIVAINGDFYLYNHGPVLRDGVLYRNEKGYDMLVMLKDGTMKTYAKGEYDRNTIKELEGAAWQIWTFGPMLLKGGEPMTKFNLPVSNIGGDNPRTAVGYYEPGHYVFVTVDGRQKGYSYPGYSMKELSRLMYDLGCKVAFNLDGGGSAEMAFGGEEANKPCSNRRKDPDALCIVDEPAPEENAAPAAGN